MSVASGGIFQQRQPNLKVLATGSVDGTATLYTTPASVTTDVRLLTLYNTDVGAVTVTLSLVSPTAVGTLIYRNAALGIAAHVWPIMDATELMLSPGWAVSATTSGPTEYSLSGIEWKLPVGQ